MLFIPGDHSQSEPVGGQRYGGPNSEDLRDQEPVIEEVCMCVFATQYTADTTVIITSGVSEQQSLCGRGYTCTCGATIEL